MRRKISITLWIVLFTAAIRAQAPMDVTYENARQASPMKWVCPEIEKYQGILYSAQNDDYKIYANNIKDQFELYSDPKMPDSKFLMTQAILTIENPLFITGNLLNHISAWINNNKKDWKKALEVDVTNKIISSSASINVAKNASFLNVNKVNITPSLVIKLVEDDKLLVSFLVERYKNDEYGGSNNQLERTFSAKISEVFPFVPKSTYKNTYAQAYVKTYQYFWNFISDLRKELNTSFTKDPVLLAQLHYDFQKDSLLAKYGEPTKVIFGSTTPSDVNKEIRFYEEAQKMIVMGTTIDFKDIMSCEIVDDPKFIPGRSTTSGLGFSFFGIGIGGAETTRTADKTIHNYVVNIKIDSMKNPLIRIATGQSEDKAEEIASTVEYILRHQQDSKNAGSPKSRTVTRRTRR